MTISTFSDVTGAIGQACVLNKPFCLGIVGAPASGKSTLAAMFKQVLVKQHPTVKVCIIPLDNFIHPNAYLKQHGLMEQKGFPCSFDVKGAIDFLQAVKENQQQSYEIPSYSHDLKDIHPTEQQTIESSDVYIFEGVSLFFKVDGQAAALSLGDHADLSVYLDTDEAVTKQRALQRFYDAFEHAKASSDPAAYFVPLLSYGQEAIQQYANDLWSNVDAPLIEQHIKPQKQHATYCVNDVPDVTSFLASTVQ